MRRLDPDHELSPEAIEAARALVAVALQSVEPASDKDLARFAAGLTTSHEQARIVRTLTRSEDLRDRLLELRAEYVAMAAGGATEGSVGSVLREVAKEAAARASRVFTGLRDWGSKHDHNDPFYLRTTRSIGQAIRASVLPRLALAHGSGGLPTTDGSLPSGVELRLELDLREPGELFATVKVTETVTYGRSSLEGRELRLELLDRVLGSETLGRGIVLDGAFTVRVPGFTERYGLGLDDLLPELFLIGTNEISLPQARRARHYATVRDESGHATGDYALFESVDGVRLDGEALSVSIVAPLTTRLAYAGYRLRLQVPLGTVDWFLGEWPVESWAEGPKTLKVPFEGASVGMIECGSILLFSLIPGS